MALAAATAHAATGVRQDVVVEDLFQAVSMDWTPDGRMVVVEKPGHVKVVNTDGSVVQVMNLSGRVNAYGDRGLTGVAVDADYATNNFVYLYYTYDAVRNDDSAKPKTARLTRIRLRPDNTIPDAVQETVILGSLPVVPGSEACPAPNNSVDCLPADGVSHVNGTVRAAPDGTLYVGFGDGVFAAANKPDPLRPLDLNSLAGKILHIDRNGRGLPGHPFCPADTNLSHNCTKVYAKGFRNPFRFGFAQRGGLWVGDVGEVRWEELDHVTSGGSYGWPCYEADIRNWPREKDPRCVAAYAAGQETGPVHAYEHGPSGACIIGGPELRSSRYPEAWQGDVVIGDIVNGGLERLHIDELGQLTGRQPFTEKWPGADLRLGPDGYLYSADFGSISRYEPVDGNRAPEARATVTPYAGLAPLDAHFDATASSDPDGDELSYSWTFGDGATGTGPTPTHVYAFDGNYTARVTVTDPGGESATAEVRVVVGNRAPNVTFVAPGAGFRYTDGVPVDLQVSAVDPEEGTLPAERVTWQIILQHNQHQHFLGTYTGTTANFTPLVSHDSDSYYVAKVTATDSAGVATTETLRLDPKTVRLELAVEPATVAELLYDGAPRAAPFVHQAASGFETTIAAPDTVKDADGKTLVFAGWSDGGAATHDIKIPGGDLRLVARYAEDTTPPETTITSGPSATTTDRRPRFEFASSEGPWYFQCKMDSAPWVACTSGWRPSQPLSYAQHTFSVQAFDKVGNADPTPAVKKFIVTPGG